MRWASANRQDDRLPSAGSQRPAPFHTATKTSRTTSWADRSLRVTRKASESSGDPKSVVEDLECAFVPVVDPVQQRDILRATFVGRVGAIACRRAGRGAQRRPDRGARAGRDHGAARPRRRMPAPAGARGRS